MKFSVSLWWTVMIPELIVVNGKLWLRSGWIFSSYSSVILFSFFSSNKSSCSTSASSVFCSCLSIRLVSSWVLYVGFIWPYGSSKRTEFIFFQWRSTLAWGGAVLYISVFLLKSLGYDPFLWLLLMGCYLVEFFFLRNGYLKGEVSSFPSCCINNYLTPLLLSSYPYLKEECIGYELNNRGVR